ncbi:MAG: universal stress protein [Rhodobacteraceae bacterium]|nr:universal stress protein [Paracoccaceae bacterium]
MFKKIMTPVDLAHVGRMEHSLACGADLARLWDIPVTYVGVIAQTPGSVAHTPEEYRQKLARFAAAQGEARGIRTGGHAVIAHDPAVDLDTALLKAVDEVGADLVVMASHIPGLVDYVWPSNGGKVAAHAAASVLVVRG